MRAGAAFALLACAAAGTAFMLTRAATLAREPVPVATHGMCAPAELLGRERLTYPANICVIELPDDGWRPLRIDIALRGGAAACGADGDDRISVNGGPARERRGGRALDDASRRASRRACPTRRASRCGSKSRRPRPHRTATRRSRLAASTSRAS